MIMPTNISHMTIKATNIMHCQFMTKNVMRFNRKPLLWYDYNYFVVHISAICIIITMYYSLSKAGSLLDRPAFKSFRGLLQFCGILLYSIDGINITLPIENNMAKPQYFPYVLNYGMYNIFLLFNRPRSHQMLSNDVVEMVLDGRMISAIAKVKLRWSLEG
jgi:hypothetical protein